MGLVPAQVFSPKTRLLFVFAHQDDELPCAGLMHRAPPGSRFLWVSNGDGLAEAAGMSQAEYGRLRRDETIRAMAIEGVGEDRLRFLGHSEVAIYKALVRLAREPRSAHEVLQMFRDMAAHVGAEIRAYRPDVVFTLAWQGGHPVHDLVHCMVRAALPAEVALYEVPEYELAYTILLRFPPWRKAPVHKIRLTTEEMEIKRQMFEVYRTQSEGLKRFRSLVSACQAVAALGGKPFGFEEYVATEEFGPVPADRDYSRSPHIVDFLDYIGDDCDGMPIRFSRMVAPVASAILARQRA